MRSPPRPVESAASPRHGPAGRRIAAVWAVLVALAVLSWLGTERPALVVAAAGTKFMLIGLVFMELWGAHRLWATLLAAFAGAWIGAWAVLG
ncbi:MAG: hypothetical protein H6702_12380 [Myxococcales bacterium]|nr:hypothetical protein [Myxococcales bacterium]